MSSCISSSPGVTRSPASNSTDQFLIDIAGRLQLEPNEMQQPAFRRVSSPTNATNIEDKTPITTTVFVGNILDRAPDMMIKLMLQKCGNVVSWKRVQGPSGKLPAFGFCEFDKPESTLRCIRLLNNWQIAEQKLLVKVDQKTTGLLNDFKRKTVIARGCTDLPMNDGESVEDDIFVNETMDAEDQRVISSFNMIMNEYAKDLQAVKNQRNSGNNITREKENHNENSCVNGDIDVEEELAIDEDKKHIVTNAIKSFRERFKDEDEKMRQTELQRKERIAQEMHSSSRVSQTSGASERMRSASDRFRHISPAYRHRTYIRPSSPTDDRRRSKRAGSPSPARRSNVSGPTTTTTIMNDSDDTRDRKRLERRLREREVQYRKRLDTWQVRERKRRSHYESEREKEVLRRKDEARCRRKMVEFLETYDDETMDCKHFKGKALARKLKDREREIELDEIDRQKEKEENGELKRKILEKDENADVFETIRKMRDEENERLRERIDEMLLSEDEEREARKQSSERKRPVVVTENRSSGVVSEDELAKSKFADDIDSDMDGARGSRSQSPEQVWYPVSNNDDTGLNVPAHAIPLPRSSPSSGSQNSPGGSSVIMTGPGTVKAGMTPPLPPPSVTASFSTPVIINPLRVTVAKRKLQVNEVFREDDDDDEEEDQASEGSRSPGSLRGRKTSNMTTNNTSSTGHHPPFRPLLIASVPTNPEDKKRAIKRLIESIPTVKVELFSYPIDWSQLDKQMMTNRIRPWVNKKIIEYIGEEELTLTDFICEKIGQNSIAEAILEDVRMVLDDEAEVFVVKMWRLLVYETEAKRNGLISTATTTTAGR